MTGRRKGNRDDEDVDRPDPGSEGVVPLEDEATGFLPVVEGEESYDSLRMPHERDESVDPPPGPRRGRRDPKPPR